MNTKDEYAYLASLGIDWERFWEEMDRLKREIQRERWDEACD